ncbi:MAG: hypothetical protein II664_01050 [Oscillospiraceae bacterium]|nr:hypothetical protein [Oscillospiraceae bacterium]
MNELKIAAVMGLCISAAVLSGIFRHTDREYGLLISLAAVIAVAASSVAALYPVLRFIDTLYAKTGADEIYLTVLYRSVGICQLTSAASGICRDSGENAVAVQAELAGRIALAVNALPLLQKIADMVEELL